MGTNLIRWMGAFALFGGVSLVLQQGYELTVPDKTSGAWVAVHTLGYFGLAFGLLGLVGVYARQMEKVGRLGLTGFLLGFIGNGLTAGAAFMNTYIVPVLTTENPELLESSGPFFTGPLGLVLLLASLLVTIGYILLGVATARARVLPAMGAWLVVISSWFGIAPIFSPVAFAVGGIVFGLGNAWLGWAIWSNTKAR